MRVIFALIVIGAVFVLGGCQKPQPIVVIIPSPTPTPTATPRSIPTPTPIPVATPAPTATPQPTPQARLAPEGILYVVKTFSVATEDGVHGFPLGQKVSIIAVDGDKTIVSKEKITASQPSSYFTNDLDVLDGLLTQVKNQSSSHVQKREEQKHEEKKKDRDTAKLQQIREKEKRYNEVNALIPRLENQRELLEEEIVKKIGSKSPEQTAREKNLKQLQKQLGGLYREQQDLYFWVKDK